MTRPSVPLVTRHGSSSSSACGRRVQNDVVAADGQLAQHPHVSRRLPVVTAAVVVALYRATAACCSVYIALRPHGALFVLSSRASESRVSSFPNHPAAIYDSGTPPALAHLKRENQRFLFIIMI